MLSRVPRLAFFLAKKYVSAGGVSFGDSNALGIAGTGGTSSSSPDGREPWLVACLGAGSRETAAGCGKRGCKEPVDVLTVLKLTVEPTERPELYDFLLISGVVLDEDGVADAFLGIIDGDLEAARVSIETGGGGGAFAFET